PHMIWALALTLLVWGGASWLARFGRGLLNPVLISTIVIGAVLLIGRIPLADYSEGAAPITAFLGPAVVALAFAIDRGARRLGRRLPILLIAGSIATVAGAAATVAVAWALGASGDLLRILAPKHATSAVSAAVAGVLGVDVSLAA